MGKEINRRELLGIGGRASIAFFIGSLFGKRRATQEVKSQKAVEDSKKNEKDTNNDKETSSREVSQGNTKDTNNSKEPISPNDTRALRTAYDATYRCNTALLTTATFGGMSLLAAQANSTQEKIEAAIEKNIPPENRPPEMKDMTEFSSRTTRRAALTATGRGLLARQYSRSAHYIPFKSRR